MAKHIVICKYFDEKFDANKEPYVMASSRRYAHATCAAAAEKSKTQKEKDKEALEAYIKQLFNISKLTPKINQQIKTFSEKNGYSYSGMLKCLIYFFETQKHSIEQANGGIGIIPYIWEQVQQYYFSLWLIQQKNEDKNIQDFRPREITISIPPPQRKIKKRKLFNFLDKENEE